MRITDRGMLLRSGYIRKVPDEPAWVVGYTAPHAQHIDEGTGPKAGHQHYATPPPLDKIRDWVKRNLQAFGMSEYKQRKSNRSHSNRDQYKRFKRILKNGQTITVIKPIKNPRFTHEFRPLRRKTDQDLIDATAKRIRLAIFAHGTEPRPFWRKAVAEIRIESRDLRNKEYMKAVRKSVSDVFYRAMKRALAIGLRVGGGRLKSW